MKPFTITTKVDISLKTIEDLLITAFEGGIDYWVSEIGHTGLKNIIKGTGIATLVDSESEAKYVVTQLSLKLALEKMAAQYPAMFADVMNNTCDADTADNFIQLAVFGDIIYG